MYDKERVSDCARKAGIPAEHFEPWDACELAVYRPPHRTGDPVSDYALDTGNKQVGLSDQQAAQFKAFLDAEKVPYEVSSRAQAFELRTKRP